MNIKHTILPAVALIATFGCGVAYHVATSHAAVTNTVQAIKDSPMTNNEAASPLPTPEVTPEPTEQSTTPTKQAASSEVANGAPMNTPAVDATPSPVPTTNPIFATNPNAPMGDQGNGIWTSN